MLPDVGLKRANGLSKLVTRDGVSISTVNAQVRNFPTMVSMLLQWLFSIFFPNWTRRWFAHVDYSTGTLDAMSSNFFPDLRRKLGPYLVDKTMLIEKIVDGRRLTGDVDLVLRPRRCGKSTMLQMLK
jgi:hypothetical protein